MSDSIKNLYEFQITSKILKSDWATDTFTISSDILTGSAVSLTNWSVLAKNRNWSVKELFKITASWGTATILSRGIKPDWTTDTTLQYERPKWTEMKVVLLEDQVFDKWNADEITWDITYQWNFTAWDTDTTKYWLSVKSLTTTEKNALSSPPDWTLILDETLWAAQMKIWWTFQSLWAWATTPNATTSVAWKIEIATDAEILAETDTWWTSATLVATPSQLSPSKLTDKTTAASWDKIRIADSADSDAAKYITINYIRDAIPASTTAKWTVEMATDAEAVAWTDETRYINAKQLNDVALTSFWIWTASRAANATWTTDVTHSLWVTPSFVKIVASFYDDSASEAHTVYSRWSYNWTTNACINAASWDVLNGAWVTESYCVFIGSEFAWNYITWTVTTMDSSKITITLSETWNLSSDINDKIRFYVEFYA